MYRIIKIDGTELGITDSVNYIKIGASGDLTNATETDAIGILFLIFCLAIDKNTQHNYNCSNRCNGGPARNSRAAEWR